MKKNKNKKKDHKHPTSQKYHTGIVDVSKKGIIFVKIKDFTEDILIKRKNKNKVFSGDEVKLHIYKRKKNNRYEGEITSIIKRNKTNFVGILQKNKNFAFVVINNPKVHVDFYIPNSTDIRSKNGEKVVVEFLDWPANAECPNGKIIKTLGTPGEHQTEIHAILAEFGLPNEFPKEVKNYANSLDTNITPEEIKKRLDLRSTLTFTIDPKDAKDYDDALSFKKLENGNYEIGVHIADVGHYLKKDSLLDQEAYNRATSVYLVDRVVPMLPEILSNKACSLRPKEEKLTFSAIFEINEEAIVQKQWFGKTVIYSDVRLAYEEAQEVIENKTNIISSKNAINGKEYKISKEIKEAILTLDNIAKKLRIKRKQSGAIFFDKVEVKFKLDSENHPKGVFFKKSKDANKLIEEFMLLANKKVAAFIGKKTSKPPFLYRTHDHPDEIKLFSLQKVVNQFGYKLDLTNKKTTSKSLNKLLKSVDGKKEQNLVDTLAIRCMSKAEYTTNNIGHYGLSFDYYTHFTSPIRRYPDVIVHRLLHTLLQNKPTTTNTDFLEEQCRHATNMEILATKAERSSIKYMQVKFMLDHQNKIYEGVISGVTERGLYVEIITNKCEGMVRIKDIPGDYYIYNPQEYALVGEKTNVIYRLGDEVKIKVKKADLIKKHLDFLLVP